MTGDATALAAESLLHAFRWYATVLAVTVVGWLALAPALARWHDAGWTIARTLSLLVFAYASWVAGHLGPLFAASVREAGRVAKAANRPLIAFSTDASVASRSRDCRPRSRPPGNAGMSVLKRRARSAWSKATPSKKPYPEPWPARDACRLCSRASYGRPHARFRSAREVRRS